MCNNFRVGKWWNSRTVGKLDIRCLFLYDLVGNILSQYFYLKGQSQIEKSIHYGGRIVLFPLNTSKRVSSLRQESYNSYSLFTKGPIAIKNYQIQILESIMLEYEQTSFIVDFRERMASGLITAEMFSQVISTNNKSFISSITSQIRDINNSFKKNNRLSSSRFRKANILFRKLL